MAIIYEPKGRAREYAPLAANLYSGCSHGCLYCYAPDAIRMKREVFHASPKPRQDIIAKLEADARKLKGEDLPPILLCFTCDPYQPAEEEHHITRQAIEVLHRYGHKVQVLTKGGLRSTRDFDLLGPGDAYAATLTFLDAGLSRLWEPHASSPTERLRALSEAHDRGITTWASLEPVIDPEQSLRIIEEAAPYVDLFKVGKLNNHPLAAEIDWRDFGTRAVRLLEDLGKDYYIKADLRRYLG